MKIDDRIRKLDESAAAKRAAQIDSLRKERDAMIPHRPRKVAP
jgi:hypothetical protein